MHPDQAIAAFRNGAFEADLPVITLRQCIDDGPLAFTGPGSIRQAPDGGFDLLAYVKPAKAFDAFRKLQQELSRQPGQLYTDQDRYACTVVDMQGTHWDAGKLLIHGNWSLVERVGVLRGHPRVLRQSHALRNGKPALDLVFFGQRVRDWEVLVGRPHVVALTATPFIFTLAVDADRDDQISVRVTADDTFPAAFERRLIEALQYVLAQSLAPSVISRSNATTREIELRGFRTNEDRSDFPPPVATRGQEMSSEALDLLRLYLDYLYRFTDDGMAHPCSAFLAMARNASGTALEAWRIGVSIASEGIAGLIEIDAKSDADAHAQVKKIVADAMKTHGIAGNLQNRVNGMLGMLDTVRPHDRMMHIARSGHALEADIKLWRDLRNAAVHTRKIEQADLSDAGVQRDIDDVFRVTRLLYAMVFYLIGYRGRITDLGRHGFPDIAYPFDLTAS